MNKNLKIFTFIFTLIYFFSSTVAPILAAISYTYDASGNMTSNGTDCYEYNDANQLKKVKKCINNQTVAEYVYDFNGDRVVKKVYNNGSLQKTIFSPSDEFEMEKLASNGATKNTSYYFANGQTIAKKDFSGNRTYFHNDHLGSTSLITSQSGSLVENTTYDPWGEVKTGGIKSKFLYTGQENDSETKLHYYNARYYDSHIRRFTQPDDMVENIYDPQMLNRYSYVRNNPLRYSDPSGHTPALLVFLTNPVTFVVAALGFGVAYTTDSTVRKATNVLVTSAISNILNNFNKAQPSKQATQPTKTQTQTNTKPNTQPATRSGGEGSGGSQPKNQPQLKYDNPNRNPAQDKKLPDSFIRKIQKYFDEGDVHSEKGDKGSSRYDIYKDRDGNLYKKFKGEKGFGEPLYKNLKEMNF